MQSSEQYITYEEYRCMGGTLDKTPFNILEFKARKKIDERTQNRLCGISIIPEGLKYCAFELIKVLDKSEKESSKDKTIASESIDGYSVTYTNADVNAQKTEEQKLEEIMMTYLNGIKVNNVPVLYLGVC